MQSVIPAQERPARNALTVARQFWKHYVHLGLNDTITITSFESHFSLCAAVELINLYLHGIKATTSYPIAERHNVDRSRIYAAESKRHNIRFHPYFFSPLGVCHFMNSSCHCATIDSQIFDVFHI